MLTDNTKNRGGMIHFKTKTQSLHTCRSQKRFFFQVDQPLNKNRKVSESMNVSVLFIWLEYHSHL
jgi:hypothetical protein